MSQEPWPGWHCVWIDQIEGGWAVNCLPHGEVAVKATHLEAFKAAMVHDIENGTHGKCE